MRNTSSRKSFFGAKLLPESEPVKHMLDWTWKRRFQKLQEQFVYRATSLVYTDVLDKIPAVPDNQMYRKSLEFVGITGLPANAVGYAISASAKPKGVRTLATDHTIVDVRKRGRLNKVSPEVKVLVDYSPWTLGNIPFMPKKSQATIVYRKVSKAEVLAVEKLRRKDRSRWQRKLRHTGTMVKPDSGQGLGRSRKATPDLVFAALRLEFGQGKSRAKPHWRPALGNLKRKGIPGMMRDREFKRTVSDPDFRGWMAWPKKTSKKISVRVVNSFVPFQKKLNIKP